MDDLGALCRDVPGFPREGIIFKDITPLLRDGEKFRGIIDQFAARYRGKRVDVVVSVEARGFIIGPAIAYKLGAGVVPVRKKGKLPWHCYQATYDLEYGTDTLEIHQDAIKPGEKVLIVDDLLATGGTVGAVIKLVERLKGEIVEVAFLIELAALRGREQIKGYPVFSLIRS
jgi:adenine phosphoribosyltransferase